MHNRHGTSSPLLLLLMAGLGLTNPCCCSTRAALYVIAISVTTFLIWVILPILGYNVETQVSNITSTIVLSG